MNEDPRVANASRTVWWPTVVYLGLLVVGIPWYWPTGNRTIVFGMPGWVIVAILVSFVASVFTAWLLRRPWPGETSETPGDHQDPAGDAS
jgi:hypothetical protein